MLYVVIWYVSIRPAVMRVKEELQRLRVFENGVLRRIFGA
jgi:CMP-2-keto-3-deoxyoctulosonic acid synthetase